MSSGFEILSPQALQDKRSYKWRQHSGSMIPLTVAEMDYNVAPAIREALSEAVNSSDMGYLGKFPEVQEAFAGFAQRHWNWSFAPSLVRIANDVGAAVSETLLVLSQPQERILINSPITNFEMWLQEINRTPYDVPLINEGMNYRLDLSGIERAFQDGIRFYLLCNPHSPVGAQFPAEDLKQVALLAEKYGAIVLSDEIHGALSYGGFTPFLTTGAAARKVGITFTSASKAFNISGLKCALYLTESPELNAQLDRIPESARHRASLFGAIATAAAFESSDAWLHDAVVEMKSSAALLKDLLSERFPEAKYRTPDFGYLAWIDFTQPWALRFESAGVALLPGNEYGTGLEYFARLNFATSHELLKRAFVSLK